MSQATFKVSPVPSHSFSVFKHFLSFERFMHVYCIYIASIPYASPLTLLTVSRLPLDFMTSSSLIIIATCTHVFTHMHTYTHKYINIMAHMRMCLKFTAWDWRTHRGFFLGKTDWGRLSSIYLPVAHPPPPLCVSVWSYLYAHSCNVHGDQMRVLEPLAGITDTCEPPSVGAGKSTQVLCQ